MVAINRILCPIDFSDFSRRALAYAAAMAGWHESSLTLLHVWPALPVVPMPPGTGVLPAPLPLTTAERERLTGDLTRLAAGAGTDPTPEVAVVEGPVAGEILRVAAELPADLIVMGSHGRSGFERLLLGSATEKVVRLARCPVLTVPPPRPESAPGAPAGFARIVCAIDFSECSLHALQQALSLAQKADARLSLVHVIERLSTVEAGLDDLAGIGARHVDDDDPAALERHARSRLENLVPDAVRACCRVDAVVATGKPYREILRVARESGADLIVAGTHGHGPIDRLLFGSTTQHLVRQATCPVLTLRHG